MTPHYDTDAFEVFRSEAFDRWLASLPEPQARARINVRIRHLSLGNAGDMKPISAGVSEMRIHYGPGYRLYLLIPHPAQAVLLRGGDKGSQRQDIARAQRLAIQWQG